MIKIEWRVKVINVLLGTPFGMGGWVGLPHPTGALYEDDTTMNADATCVGLG